MSDRIKYLQEQCAMVRSYSEPFVAELKIILLEQWGLGYSIPQLAELFEYKESTIKQYLNQMGIDWRNSELPQHEPELKLKY